MLMRRGVTLIELVVVVTILSLLGLLGSSSYQHFRVVKNRVLASQTLNRNVNSMERYYALHGHYDAGDGLWPALIESTVVGSTGVVYNISLVPAHPPVHAQVYKMVAIPAAGSIQVADGNLCIDQAATLLWPVDANCF